jgi:hypothetical protein
MANADVHNLRYARSNQYVRLNQPYSDANPVRYDVLFRNAKDREIIVELKTVVDGDLDYTRRYDLKKWFPPKSAVYFLIVSYPYQPHPQLDLDGTDPVETGRIHNHPYFLYRKRG